MRRGRSRLDQAISTIVRRHAGTDLALVLALEAWQEWQQECHRLGAGRRVDV
jgi:hypothetical protein